MWFNCKGCDFIFIYMNVIFKLKVKRKKWFMVCIYKFSVILLFVKLMSVILLELWRKLLYEIIL